jgi:ubiquinone/menaquinone biosynthesis C-methylase UbiE
MSSAWNPAETAQFFDEYGEREWTRFEDGRTPLWSVATHVRMLERYVRPGDRALDAGAGPGRFALELQRIGATVTAVDISPVQLDELRRRCPDVEAHLCDITDLSRFPDDSFDATVCYGGPLSYLLDDAEHGVAELARVTRSGGHLLVSVMSLGGAVVHYAAMIAELAQRDGPDTSREIIRTQILPRKPDYGHLALKLYRWSDVAALLAPHGEVVDGAAAGVMPHVSDARELIAEFDAALADDPAMRGCGDHIIGVLQVA